MPAQREIIPILRDGNCLFRAISHCIHETQDHHRRIRLQTVNKIYAEWNNYKNFIIGDETYQPPVRNKTNYRNLMSKNGEFAGHVELHCLGKVFANFTFKVHRDGSDELRCFGEGPSIRHLLFSGHRDRGHFDVIKFSDVSESSVCPTPAVTQRNHLPKKKMSQKRKQQNDRERKKKMEKVELLTNHCDVGNLNIPGFADSQTQGNVSSSKRLPKKKMCVERKQENNMNRKREVRDEETSDERRRRLENDKKRKSDERRNEDEVKKKKRMEADKIRTAKRISQEENAKKQRRQEENRQKMAVRRSKPKNYLGENVPDKVPPLLIGLPSNSCLHCGALSFESETGRSVNSCCHGGKVKLNPLPEFPNELRKLFQENTNDSLHFRKNIRFYNNSFAMAAFCPAQDATVPGVGCLKVRGEVNVRATTSMVPSDGQQPSYAQIYLYDNETALNFRSSEKCRASILQIIQAVMDHNPYAQIYKTLFQFYRENDFDPEINLRFLRSKKDDHRRYNEPAPGVTEVAAIVFTGAEGRIPAEVDFIAYPKHQFQSKIIHKLSHHNEPMVFPLFFPEGTPGYSLNVYNANREHFRVTAAQYFGQRLSIHRGKFNPILSGARLTQQYIIFGYIVVEWNRLNYFKSNQHLFRRETLQGLADHVQNSAANTSNNIRLGNVTCLPSSFDGGPRAMQQLYQDSMAMTRELGRPDLFITFTANPRWPEITEFLKTMPAGTTASDIPYFVVRAFNCRLQSFLEEISSGKVFGPVSGYTYTIEFQKRGLPHAHCIFILSHRNKLLTPEAIDRFISAEIPDKDEFPELHQKVMKHMLHGPHTEASPCWNETSGICTKKFPHAFTPVTDMSGDGFPRYRRRDNRHKCYFYNARVNGRRVPVDNSMVAAFNAYLLLKYDCHINCEYCGSILAFKYIHKYITKGHDRIRVTLSDSTEEQGQNEIDDFIDSRYVSAMEAAWRLLEISMHGHSHAVIRLPVHLDGHQYVTFAEGREADAITEKRATTKLTAYFKLNQDDRKARELFYADIPKHYVWSDEEKKWNKRQRQRRIIARLYSVSPKDPERFFLKVLLRNVKGAKCFKDLKIVDGTTFKTFKEAAYARGFCSEPTDVEEIMTEASSTMMPRSLRAFFSYLLLTCEHINGAVLWEKFKQFLCEGTTEVNAIKDIEIRLNGEEKSLKDFGIEVSLETPNVFEDGLNDDEHFTLACQMIAQLNHEQKLIFDEISAAISSPHASKKLFFVDGFGGTGKTFLYKCLYHYHRHSHKKIVCVAWTGIAAILLPNGKTAHRVFKLPLQLNPDGTVTPIPLTRKTKQILAEVDFIIWDEASMIPAIALSLIDATLRDLMRNDEPFGGKIVLLGGDFRQVLPVVKKASRFQIVNATLVSSPLWQHFQHFQLKQNMRAENEVFSNWLLEVGNGDIDRLKVPSSMLSADIIESIYGTEITEDNLKTSVLLASRNAEVDRLNEQVLKKLPGETVILEGFSWATAVDGDDTDNDELMLRYQPEYLSSLNPTGMPHQRLQLKVGAIVMLLRNLCISDGLCNGTRLKVLKIEKNVLCCSILTGDKQGDIVVIPKIVINTKGDSQLPFVLNRKQFPVRLAFAMTINKCQGQTFDKVGLYLDQNRPIFGHGQLYVALSRCRSMAGLKIQIVGAKNSEEKNHICNIVYHEVLTAQRSK